VGQGNSTIEPVHLMLALMQQQGGAARPLLAAMIELARLGVEDVQGGELCTACDLTRFYSFRKEGDTGRFASLIWLDEEGN
jgi:hypothetical protein